MGCSVTQIWNRQHGQQKHQNGRKNECTFEREQGEEVVKIDNEEDDNDDGGDGIFLFSFFHW